MAILRILFHINTYFRKKNYKSLIISAQRKQHIRKQRVKKASDDREKKKIERIFGVSFRKARDRFHRVAAQGKNKPGRSDGNNSKGMGIGLTVRHEIPVVGLTVRHNMLDVGLMFRHDMLVVSLTVRHDMLDVGLTVRHEIPVVGLTVRHTPAFGPPSPRGDGAAAQHFLIIDNLSDASAHPLLERGAAKRRGVSSHQTCVKNQDKSPQKEPNATKNSFWIIFGQFMAIRVQLPWASRPPRKRPSKPPLKATFPHNTHTYSYLPQKHTNFNPVS